MAPTPLVLPNSTLFLLTPVAGAYVPFLTPYSARGLSQTLEPIAGVGGGGSALGTWIRRDLNGTLCDLSDTALRKYVSTVSCNDTETPCLDNLWLGTVCQVSCACELSYPTGATPQRPQVSGSTRVEGSVTFYRPLLQMMVAEIKNSFQEYRAAYAWQLLLAEV